MSFGGGKVILLGEHAVVHGTPAIAAGLRRGVHARAEPAATTTLRCAPWGTVSTLDAEDDLSRALAAVVGAHPRAPLPPLEVTAEVELPAGAGLGCSAALGVAVVRALDEAVGLEAGADAVAERTLAWERVFHGNPSGLDNTMAAHGGVACFERGAPLAPLDVRRPLSLVIGDSGEPSSTKAMVASVQRQRDRDEARFVSTLEAIHALVRNARLALEAGDVRAVGQLLDMNQALLSSWMVSTPALEEMCAAARGAGASGAKLTGAGGGGCMIALVPDAEVGVAVEGAIRALGHDAFRVEAG